MLYCTSDFENMPKVLVVKIIVHSSPTRRKGV